MNNKPKNATYAGDSSGSMDQVRDLLFGAQIKEMDTRLQRQEERFARSVEDAKSALKNRIDTLETFMKSEVSSLLARIKEEQTEREEELKKEQRERNAELAKISKELSTATETSERKLAKLSATLDNTERELRQLLMSESSSLSEKIQEKYQDSLDVLKSTSSQIRADMVYRASLASMFTETALKLNGQWTTEMEQGDPGIPLPPPIEKPSTPPQNK